MSSMNAINIKRLSSSDNDFDLRLDQLLAWENVSDGQVEDVVADILNNVRQNGDAALVEYTNRFDRRQITNVAELSITKAELKDALGGLPEAERQALELAADRIRYYHQHQKQGNCGRQGPSDPTV